MSCLIDYAYESDIPCKCGSPAWKAGAVLDSGKAPAVHGAGFNYWFEGSVTCECGHVVEIGDSSE